MKNKFPGKLIVFYGINNLGKSTQAKKLVEKINSQGEKAQYLKYPIYNLEPTGPIINNYLREGNKYNLSAREAQLLYTLNRYHYQKHLASLLKQGINVIAEDYIGTGIAWGITAGVNEEFLKTINKGLIEEDLVFLFDGERFIQSEEKSHRHENDYDLTNKSRWSHLKLKEERGWIKIQANQPIEKIHQEIWDITRETLKLKWKPEKIIEKINPNSLPLKQIKNKELLFDIYSPQEKVLKPQEKIKINTGLKLNLPGNYLAFVLEQKELKNSKIKAINDILDNSLSSELKIKLVNLSHESYTIKRGDKIAQLYLKRKT